MSLIGQQAVANAGQLSAAISAYLLGLQAQALQGGVSFGSIPADDLLLWVQLVPDEVVAQADEVDLFVVTAPDAEYVQHDLGSEFVQTEPNEEFV